MEKQLLRPRELSVDPESADAALVFKYWLRTVEDFISGLEDLRSGDAPALNKKRIVIGCLSPTIYPHVEDADSYDSVVASLTSLYIKKKNNVYCRHLLVSRRQETGETISEFLNALKALAKECTFTNVTAAEYKEQLTRDAFINGITSSVIRQRLLEKELSLTEAFELADSLDRAQRYSSRIVMQTTTSPLSAAHAKTDESSLGAGYSACSSQKTTFSSSPAPDNAPSCFFCGLKTHQSRSLCPARKVTCHLCGKRGHFARVCQSKNSSTKAPTVASVATPGSSTALAERYLASAPSSLESTVVQGSLDGTPVHVLIDSGASENFINHCVCNRLSLPINGREFAVGMASSSFSVQTLGDTTADLELLENTYPSCSFSVLENLCTDVVLGQRFLKQHSSVTFALNGPRKSLTITPSNLVANRGEIAVAAAELDPPRLFEFLLPGCKPIAAPSRRYSSDDMQFIQSEIQRMLQADIIEPARSPWRAQVLVVRQGPKMRMVVDYSVTINRFTLLDAYPLPNIEDLVNKIARDKYFSSLDLRSAYHQVPISADERHYTAFEAGGRLFQYKRLPFGVTNGVSAFQRSIDKFIETNKLEKVYAYLDDITVTGETLEEHNNNLRRLLEAAAKCRLTINEEKSKIRVTELEILGHRISYKKIEPDPKRLQALLELPIPTCTKELQRVSGLFSYYAKWIPNFSKKAGPLLHCKVFPLSENAVIAFDLLKADLCKASLGSIQSELPFTIETDASDVAIAAVLSQDGRPVAFMSRTLSTSEKRYPAVEKEATAIIEAVRKWLHFLKGRHFSLVTDQEAVSFMLNQTNRGKIKNAKILSWRLEMSQLHYDIRHKPGIQNVAPDALSRACSLAPSMSLTQLHESLGHPGYARLYHFILQRNLPYTSEETKTVCKLCRTCAELKPRFFKPPTQNLIKAIRPWDRISIDFKGPVKGVNSFLLVVVDEYSRFPFVFPCKNTKSRTVIECLDSLFCVFGFPCCVHSDRGSSFVSEETRSFLSSRGISFSTSTAYHPTGNSQCERYNQTIWRTVKLLLHGRRLPEDKWEVVLAEALHAVRSLVCLSTNETPHERMFRFSRKALNGTALPSWLLTPGTVLLRRHVRNKGDPFCDQVELVEGNATYSTIRFPDGRQSTVSTSDLAPCPPTSEVRREDSSISPPGAKEVSQDNSKNDGVIEAGGTDDIPIEEPEDSVRDDDSTEEPTVCESTPPTPSPLPRRSTRIRKPPDRYTCNVINLKGEIEEN